MSHFSIGLSYGVSDGKNIKLAAYGYSLKSEQFSFLNNDNKAF